MQTTSTALVGAGDPNPQGELQRLSKTLEIQKDLIYSLSDRLHLVRAASPPADSSKGDLGLPNEHVSALIYALELNNTMIQDVLESLVI